MKHSLILKWSILVVPILLLGIYVASYLYCRKKAGEDRYEPGSWARSEMVMRNVSAFTWTEEEPLYAFLEPILPKPKLSSHSRIVRSVFGPASLNGYINYRDPHLYLPPKLEHALHILYTPLQIIDFTFSGFAVGFNKDKS